MFTPIVRILEYDNFQAPVDEMLILKVTRHHVDMSKSQEMEPYLNGRCIYLVGMMGSGKTTVAKILSQVLSYAFFDSFNWKFYVFLFAFGSSDALVEEEVDGTSVADIFKYYGETFFRNKEVTPPHLSTHPFSSLCGIRGFLDMVAELGHGNVSDLSPAAIAMEALEQIKDFLVSEDGSVLLTHNYILPNMTYNSLAKETDIIHCQSENVQT
ncbi:unnamed protein product [Sphenostylis stenocarpa]|uniref:Uncharacterized protein n=1 Tax=Sphenostylis stenocarpa TaxID=92480 RepID=A0AA86TPJ1_9FABA|nr:unnamed protein product [Sphenostylis stenocarpa]